VIAFNGECVTTLLDSSQDGSKFLDLFFSVDFHSDTYFTVDNVA